MKEFIAMTQTKKQGVTKEFIRAYRYEIVLEALQLFLTDASWFKEDLANYLNIDYEYINKLLTRRYYPVSNRLMRQVKQLYQQKYGNYKWEIINQHLKLIRFVHLDKEQTSQDD